MKLYFSNSGCSAERLDFNRILTATKAEESINPFGADVIIAHLCAISTDAFKTIPEQMSIFQGIKKNIPETKIFVGGCAEGLIDLKKRYPFIDGTFRRRKMVEDLAEYLSYNVEGVKEEPTNYYNAIHIQSGCMRNCGFCKKAYLDMPLTSRPINLVVNDIKKAVSEGHTDIMLLAENSTEYGIDLSENVRLIDLLKTVVEIEGVKAVRLTGLCIDELAMSQNDELLQFIKNCDKIFMVQTEIQSLIPEVRKNMRLTSSVEDVLRVLKELSGKHIITNVMVGYPGETTDGFENQLKLIEEENLYFIEFNKYDNTPLVYANSLEQVNPNLVSQRLIKLAETIKRLRRRKVKELVKATNQEPISCVYTTEKRLMVLGESALVSVGRDVNVSIGDIVKVKITGVENFFDMNDPSQYLCLEGVRVWS